LQWQASIKTNTHLKVMYNLPEITSIYFDPTTDFGFKKLFGEEINKDLLMNFLNSMLPPNHQISSLTFQKTEQLPDHEDERKAIYDILCQDKNGEKFIIEMQKSRMTYFPDRSVYYSSFPIQSQAIKGKWDFNLSRVYFIAILNFEYDENVKYWKKRQLLRSFSLRDDKGVLMTDNLHFKFLQLPLFTKKEHQLKTQFDKWCFFLNNLETFDKIPKILNEPVFMKAFEVATVHNMDPNDYILYQISKSKKYDMELLEDEAEERGIEKTKISHVLTIHTKGYTPLQISDLLTMPIARVIEIIEKYGAKH
jgi:predicted transposase/invertase (TIGR01784 family)